jgi:PKD repeat protein
MNIVNDNLRFIKAKLQSQKLVKKAILGIQPTEQTDQQPDHLIQQVQLYNQTSDTDFENSIQQSFSDIMRQYISDEQLIADLFHEIGNASAQEFVLNYNAYIPKLKKIEGQRLNKSKLFAFFKDMLAENLVKKGLANTNNNNSLLSHSTAPLRTINQSVFSPIVASPSPIKFTTPTQNIASPALKGPATPIQNVASPALKGPATPIQNVTPQATTPSLNNKITAEYDIVFKKALDSLKNAVSDPKLVNKTREDILKDVFNDMRTKVTFKSPSDPSKKKQVKHNKDTLTYTIMQHIDESISTGKYDRVFGTLEALDLVNPSNIADNIYQSLYLPKSDFIAFREKTGYSGHGLNGNLKAHHTIINNKYYVDRKKLGNGVLEVRYAKNKHLAGKVKPQYVSQELKNVIDKIIDEKKIDKNAYHKLNKQEQHLVRNLNQMFDINDDIEDSDSFQERMNIVIGEIRAGNTNLALKQEARQYILHAMRMNKIPRNVAYDLLMEIQ